MRQDFNRTVPLVRQSLDQQNLPPPIIKKEDVQGMFTNNLGKIHQSRDDKVMIARASVNPIILLLCFDQGVTSDTYYTAMASPLVNGRSLDSEHVESVCNSLLHKESNVFSSEDYTIVPYYVVPGSSTETNSEMELGMEMGGSDENEKELGMELGGGREEEQSIKKKHDVGPINYKCILNRDRNTNEGDVLGKKADCLSTDRLISTYNTVSSPQ